MYRHLIVRAHRQHSSIVMTIPKALCRQLKIEAGDYILLSFRDDGDSVQLDRFVGKDGKDARGKTVAGRENKGR